MLALPPGYATGVFPPAGIAVAAVMIGGVRLLPGVLLGAFILNFINGYSLASGWALASFFAACIVACGSALQAWVGSALLHRWVKPGIDSTRDVMLFLLLAPLLCFISASIAIPSFYWLKIMPAAVLLENWLTWWVGDTVGVLLAAR